MLRPEYTQEIRWAIPLLLLQKHTEDYAHRSTIQLEKDAKINTDTVYQRCRASRFVLWFWSRSLTIQLFLIFFVHFILEVVVKMVSPKNAIIPTPQLDWTVYFFFLGVFVGNYECRLSWFCQMCITHQCKVMSTGTFAP